MGDLILGDYSYSFAERRGTANTVTIGNFCSIAILSVFDGGFTHRPDFISTSPLQEMIVGLKHLPHNIKIPGDIIICNGVWIGENCAIIPPNGNPLTIGEGAIVAYGAVVTKDVPPYSIVGGVPAKFIKWRFTLEQIEKLKQINWYEWPEEKIKENAHLLQSDNIEEFISIHG